MMRRVPTRPKIKARDTARNSVPLSDCTMLRLVKHCVATNQRVSDVAERAVRMLVAYESPRTTLLAFGEHLSGLGNLIAKEAVEKAAREREERAA